MKKPSDWKDAAALPGRLIAEAREAVFALSSSGDILAWSRGAETLFGFHASESLGRSIVDLVVSDSSRSQTESALREAVESEAADLLLECAWRHRNGESLDVDVWLRWVSMSEDEGFLAASARAATPILRLRAAALAHESEQDVFQLLFEAAPDARVVVDRHGEILFVNARAETLFGYRRQELVGQKVEKLIPQRFGPQRADLFTDPSVREMGFGGELHALRKDGSELPIEIGSSPIETAAGTLVSSTIRAVIERREAMEGVERAREAAELARRELEAFSYSVAHDLRAPLRGIDGFSHALLEGHLERLDEDGKRYLDKIRDSARYMGRLIDALLMLSRLTQSDLNRRKVDLSALARSIGGQLQSSAPERSASFIVADGLVADGDPRLLRSALENLLGNAWKFSAARDAAEIEFGRTGDLEPAFFVRDNGVGFDMAHAQKLFGVFQRLHSRCEFEGTGVGLAAVQRIIHRHGGRIWAESEVDRGTTFRFTLGPKESR